MQTDLMDARTFICAHTRPLRVPSVPSIVLYQADEVTPLWLLTEADLRAGPLSPPFWAFAWSGGQVLASYILLHPEIVKGRRVLDLACGSGLVGIAAKLAGATSVIGNDIDPYCEAAVALNSELNHTNIEFCSRNLLDTAPLDVDVILAGDICYERTMTDAMLRYCRQAMQNGSEIYLGDPHRTYFPKSGLTKLSSCDILTNKDIEDAATKTASVWKMEPME